MPHGILDNWLKDQIGNAHVQYAGVDSDIGGQAILETNTLDLEVSVQEFDFLLQCHFLCAGIFERQSQEIAQASNHGARGIYILIQKGRNRVQSVEKKVRMQLHLQCFQLRLRELGPKLRAIQLALSKTLVIIKSVTAEHDDEVNQ